MNRRIFLKALGTAILFPSTVVAALEKTAQFAVTGGSAISDDFYFEASSGFIRYTGSGKIYTTLEFFKWLYEIEDTEPKIDMVRHTDHIVDIGKNKIDIDVAKHLKEGSLITNNGSEVFSAEMVFKKE